MKKFNFLAAIMFSIVAAAIGGVMVSVATIEVGTLHPLTYYLCAWATTLVGALAGYFIE